MNIQDRPTPETNEKLVHAEDALKLYRDGNSRWRSVVPTDFARSLEQQRDALREALKNLVIQIRSTPDCWFTEESEGFDLIEADTALAATKPTP